MEQSRLSGLSDQPPVRCAAGAVPELWDAMEPLTLVIPTFNGAETIGGVILFRQERVVGPLLHVTVRLIVSD
jgi:hypothetical protein